MGYQFKTMSSDDFGKRVYKKINGRRHPYKPRHIRRLG